MYPEYKPTKFAMKCFFKRPNSSKGIIFSAFYTKTYYFFLLKNSPWY